MTKWGLVLALLALVFCMPAFGQTGITGKLVGEWRGTYTCGQGKTGLTLIFSPASGSKLDGVFSFYPTAQNPGVPSGSYRFTASGNADGRSFKATAGKWIEQPKNYVTVNFSGALSGDGTVLSGQINNSSCRDFRVARVASGGSQAGLLANAGVVGEWRGTYTCEQGQTGMMLSFSPAGADALQGIFWFFPADGEAKEPSGSFEFSATLEKDGRSFLATAGNWIRQPPGFVTVDFSGRLSSDGNSVSGQILNSRCSVFQVTRGLPPTREGVAIPDAGRIARPESDPGRTSR